MGARISPTLISIVIAGIAFIVTPYLPMWVLTPLAGSRVGTAIMLIAVLAVLQFDVVISLAVALAVAAVFIEYRRRILNKIQNTLILPDQPDMVSNIGSTRKLVPNEVHPPAEAPSIEEVGEQRENDAPGSTREPLDTIDTHSEAIAKLMEENGFASLTSQ
jgi:hypothetical protein